MPVVSAPLLLPFLHAPSAMSAAAVSSATAVLVIPASSMSDDEVERGPGATSMLPGFRAASLDFSRVARPD
jgi:hypothetical protein